jgi:hypothetical protein
MDIHKILKPFLRLTVEEKSPTDLELDQDIDYASYLIHRISPLLRRIIISKFKRFFKYRWKILFGRLTYISLVLLLFYLAFVKVMKVEIKHIEYKNCVTLYPSDTSMNIKNYLKQISYIESRYEKTARRENSQYLGLFQLGIDVRKTVNMDDVCEKVFLNHQEFQYLAMIKLLKHNKKLLQKYIDKYSGKVIDGILVTESGILALAQLGIGTTKKYLDSGIIPESDDNGNPPRKFLILGGYQLQLEKYNEDGLRFN